MLVQRGSMALVAVAVLALLVACGGDDSNDVGWNARAIAGTQADLPFTAIVANSPPGIGVNRLAIGLVDGGALLPDAEVTMRVYRLAERPEDEPDQADLLVEEPATARSISVDTDHVHTDGAVHVHSGPLSTVYVANVEFDAEGWWGVELDVEVEGERYEGIRSTLWVRDHSSEPGVGDAVPRSTQKTLRDVDDITEIDSSTPPNPGLHELTVAEALDTGKPVVVAFVTPAFCETRFCGPVMEEVILPMREEFGDRVEFIHIEPFDLPQIRAGQRVAVPTVEEWGLLSEPFVFVLTPDGTVAAKFEGIMEAEEIATALHSVLGS